MKCKIIFLLFNILLFSCKTVALDIPNCYILVKDLSPVNSENHYVFSIIDTRNERIHPLLFSRRIDLGNYGGYEILDEENLNIVFLSNEAIPNICIYSIAEKRIIEKVGLDKCSNANEIQGIRGMELGNNNNILFFSNENVYEWNITEQFYKEIFSTVHYILQIYQMKSDRRVIVSVEDRSEELYNPKDYFGYIENNEISIISHFDRGPVNFNDPLNRIYFNNESNGTLCYYDMASTKISSIPDDEIFGETLASGRLYFINNDQYILYEQLFFPPFRKIVNFIDTISYRTRRTHIAIRELGTEDVLKLEGLYSHGAKNSFRVIETEDALKLLELSQDE